MFNLISQAIILFGITFSNAKDEKQLALQRLKKIGIDPIVFDLDKNYSKYYFTITLLDRATVNNVILPKGSQIHVQEIYSKSTKPYVKSDEVTIIMLPEKNPVVYQGVSCSRMDLIHNDLSRCSLVEDLKYKSLHIPKKSEVIFDRTLKKENQAVPVLIESLSEDIEVNKKTFHARSGLLKITEDGDLTPDGAKEIYSKVLPGSD